ncbi:MAG: lysophospholipid acyltransferase family protein [Alkaliphilus sp.]
MERFFEGDKYTTPTNTPRFLLDRIMFDSRIRFISEFLVQILKSYFKVIRGKYNLEEGAKVSYNIFKTIEGCGGCFDIQGLDNLDKCDGPVVFVSNHMSTLETVIFPCLIAPIMDVTYIAKESLTKYPIFGAVIKSRQPIILRRVNPREDLLKVLTEGKSILENGRSMIIFPQSTRSIKFIPEEFNSLGVKLAKKANVKILPIAIKTDFWENGKYIKDLGPINRDKKIYIKFGEPLTIEGNGKEAHNKTKEFIGENTRKWDAENK